MNDISFTSYTASADETISLGRKLGAALKTGDVVALVGELGSGKTCFAKGLGLGLGVASDTVINSPSFSLVNEYEGRYPFYHIDGYRLENLLEFLSAGLDHYFNMEGVVAMEWADRWPEILPDYNIRVELMIEGEVNRKITLTANHPRAIEILEEIKNA
ncbi:tRNA threonylcarbamoyladenosine biosynthesis protein TsaE [uncultured Desulfobacterium sp.]|uniref:tRNA threonylcarbamoyladenosine biosynthesis protein TsaE n=1 Tax=uncultured Desulfobacterium sp. TaxID=201089 RepID=A0A445N2L5_9BACT|nr:tRNA threonylcarbamoyladenosine biosynthesis protein TsaE [uncultured Desulfobacterium sp.]